MHNGAIKRQCRNTVKTYKKLSPAQRDKIKELCPQRIAEQYNGTADMNETQHQNRTVEARQANNGTTLPAVQAANSPTQKGGVQ